MNSEKNFYFSKPFPAITEFLDSVDSTNEYIKRYVDGGKEAIVAAARQTAGKGTKGRTFISDAGGVYFSALSFRRIPISRAFTVMAYAATAVCRTAEEFGVFPEIKWPNDVLVNRRKLSGILIENYFSGGEIAASIVGIGLNAENDLSALNGLAISLSEAAGKRVTAKEAREALTKNFLRSADFSDYLKYFRMKGEEITVDEGGRRYSARAEGVSEKGELIVNSNGKEILLSAGEIFIGGI